MDTLFYLFNYLFQQEKIERLEEKFDKVRSHNTSQTTQKSSGETSGKQDTSNSRKECLSIDIKRIQQI